jgi:hypothetical protein
MYGILAYDRQVNDYYLLIFKKQEDAYEAYNGLKEMGNLRELSIKNKLKVKMAMNKLSFKEIVILSQAPPDLIVINKNAPLIY